MRKLTIFLSLALFSTASCSQIEKYIDKSSKKKPLTNEEVIKALREALVIGTNNSSASASKVDGFYGNLLIKIHFPEEAIKIKNAVEKLGMASQVEKFVLTLNRAAEEAAKDAAPIFINAITSLTIADGFSILRGPDNAATQYLSSKTSTQLHTKFKPVVNSALQKVNLTKYWKPLIDTYNKIPTVQKMNPDLDEYVTQKALVGLFKLIAEEELQIRRNPAARVTELLKKVFGSPNE